MKYFVFICLFIFLLLCLWSIVRYYAHLKIWHFYKLSFNALYKKQKSEPYVSSFYLMQIIKFLVKKHQNRILLLLSSGKTKPAETFLLKHRLYLQALLLKIMSSSAQNINQLENFVKDNPNNKAAIAELAILYFNENDISKTKQCLNNLPVSGKNNYILARSLYLQAFFDAREGDLLSASVHANQAVQIFHKLKAFYEEALAYLVSGIIYRTAIITDVAQMMFETALKIFQELNLPNEKAKIFGNLGMLMAIQKRFDEAIVEFTHAHNANPKDKNTLIELANLYTNNGEKFASMEYWKKVYEIDKDKRAGEILGEFYYQQGDLKLAEYYGKTIEKKELKEAQYQDEGLLEKIISFFSKK